LEVGRVIRKDRKHLIIEYWEVLETNSMGHTLIRKCNRCLHRKIFEASCTVRLKNSSWYQVIKEVHSKGETRIIRIPLSAFAKIEKVVNDMATVKEELVEVSIVRIEKAILQREISDIEIRKELGDIIKKLEGRREVNIYTDRSLVTDVGNSQNMKRMCIGWVVVDLDNCNSSISFNSRIVN
jgi:hypothetical protein